MARYEALGNAIESAVRKNCEGKEVVIAFSGGMDSGLAAALCEDQREGPNGLFPVPYTRIVGVPDLFVIEIVHDDCSNHTGRERLQTDAHICL